MVMNRESAVEVGGVAGADVGQESCRLMIRSALRLRMPSWGARSVSVTLMADDSKIGTNPVPKAHPY
jgi:hypothetical protein